MSIRFNPLDHPSIFMLPDYLDDESAWIEHIPFAFLLMDLARPRVVVELGTLSGVSYCALCQGAAKLRLSARCYAVDTWKGDAQTGYYSEQPLQRLRKHHDPHYGAFSELVQSTFDEALGRFADGSIDVLHIDGLHTLEAVTHDYEVWKPKLSKAGIVLFHDTMIKEPDFGVCKLWAELEKQFPSFEFEHGSGLGVLAVGEDVPSKMIEFLEEANNNRETVCKLFWGLGNRCVMRYLFRFTFQQQRMVNQWKRQVGEAVDPKSENIHEAMLDPIDYAKNVTREMQRLANENLQLRLGSNPGAKQQKG